MERQVTEQVDNTEPIGIFENLHTRFLKGGPALSGSIMENQSSRGHSMLRGKLATFRIIGSCLALRSFYQK